MRLLRWLAVLLSLAGAFVPAVGLATPWAPERQWSAWQLSRAAGEAAQELHQPQASKAGGSSWIDDLRQLRAALPADSLHHSGVADALRWAAVVPLATLLAGLCALLAVPLQLVRWRRARLTVATAGGVSAILADAAATWLNHALQTAWAALAGGVHMAPLATAALRWLAGGLEVTVGAGLYLMLAGFLATLLLPQTN